MAKYQATGLLWSPSQNRTIQIGEVIDLDDEIARKLLALDVIEPAVLKLRIIKRDKEKHNGSNNE